MSLQMDKQFFGDLFRTVIISVLILSSLSSVAVAGTPEAVEHVIVSANLQRDGQLATQREVPLLLMVSAEECPYCMVMESDYLVPLLRNRDYDDKVLIRKIHLDSFDDIIGFSGESVAPTDLSQDYGVWVTPTLLFLDGKGKEVQKRMIGLGVRDFVSAYIDESLVRATDAMKRLLP
ncbi:MAG: thioredoxin fold domain-containing protein [Gammaproteobacteria bacterium]|uniref:Thioredoxin fold domain-containing protein n=1 Tax=Candidatus Thiopontia autotrophica TaxID=2841688 RepID=A0A8J6P3Y1_9GAMM|nr:thioredoxin fold domain-containing protein [Candidatus Thiopontia autotrophica]MBL6969347.1 thioredoxin fold domain-containing protein [Gammaproteobacteria bacterium]